MTNRRFAFALLLVLCLSAVRAFAAVSLPFTVNMSEAVVVDTTGGTPRIALDVGGVTRYAAYASGSGTSALTFTYDAQAGDVDLDGIAVSSPVELNGGTIRDLAGNPLANLAFTPPVTTGVKIDYPSLSMDFINSRYTLNGTAYTTLPSFLTATGGTFSRASIGTYYNSSGVLQTATSGTPRFDHDPVTLAPKGILIEEGRTNLIKYSNDFSNAIWAKQNSFSVVQNNAVAPDGTMSAATIYSPNAASAFLYQSVTPTVGTYTLSVWIRATSGTKTFKLGYFSPTQQSSMMTATTSWKRFYFTTTVSAGGNFYPCQPTNSNDVFEIWGAQLEQGTFPTSYIPTTAATVTRAADNLSMPYGAWFDANLGTWYGQAYSSPNLGNGRIIGNNGAGTANFLSWNNATGTSAETWNGATLIAVGVSPPATNNVSARLAVNYNNALPSRSIVANAGSVSTSATSMTTGTSVQIGSSGISAVIGNSISKAKYYPVRVSSTQLQLLTQ